MPLPRRLSALPLVPISIGAVLAIGAGALALAWFLALPKGTSTGSSRETVSSKRRSLVVAVSGDTAGWIVPCGCTSSQSGGLLRRGSLLADLREKHELVYLDAGGAPSGISLYDREKFEAVLAGERLLNIAAHNLGGPEAALGPQQLREIAARMSAPFVSANLRDAEGQLIAEPYRIVQTPAGKLAVVGVLSATYQAGDCRVGDPRQAILDLLPRMAGEYDWLAILAYLPVDELRTFASSLPEADLIIGGPTGQCIPPIEVGPTLLASATNKGKFLLTLRPPEVGARGPWQGTVLELNESYPDDHTQVDNLAQFRQDLAELDIAAADSGLLANAAAQFPPDYRVAGTTTCRNCHADDCQTWDASAHGHAWATLANQGAHVDSYCQQCHTTAFGLPGGFVSAKRGIDQTNVGCESCHGPSRTHALNTTRRTPWVARDQCVRCHDRENSPRFELAAYWEQIVHGGEKAVPTSQEVAE
jgi:Cytochrome c554 and c-prime